VLTGHTLDDPESRRWRCGRRAVATGRGLAGMAPATLYEGRVLDPAGRCFTPAALSCASYLRGRDIAWFDDPTNVDSKYERGANCGAGDGAGHRGAREQGLLAAASQRIALGDAGAALIRAHARLCCAGADRPRPQISRRRTRPGCCRLCFARSCSAVAGRDGAIARRLRARTAPPRPGLGKETFRATLSRAVVDARPQTRSSCGGRNRDLTVVPAPARQCGDFWTGRFPDRRPAGRINAGGRPGPAVAKGDRRDVIRFSRVPTCQPSLERAGVGD